MMKRSVAALCGALIIAVCGLSVGCASDERERSETEPPTRNDAAFTQSLTDTEKEFNGLFDNPGNFPVSFVYGGVYYDGLRGFTVESRSDTLSGAKRTLNIKLSHPDKKLAVTVEAAVYPNYDAYEWTVWFANEGKTDSAVLSDVWACDMSLKGANPYIKGNMGDYGGYFVPYEKKLGDDSLVFDADTGRSSEQYLPYFNVETDSGGVMTAVGWPGTWRTEFKYDGTSTRMLATGTTGLYAYLKPGERIRTALMAFVRYYERDEAHAVNKWRRWAIDCNMPYEDAAETHKVQATATVGFVSDTPQGWYRGGSEFENSGTWRSSYEAVKSRGLRFDYHWFDAGWYTDPGGSSLPDSWFGVGSWTIDSAKWPQNTLKEYTDKMEEGLGVKGTLMWFEVERFHGAVDVFQSTYGANPDWLIPAQGENYLVWHGNDEAVDWLFAKIVTAMDKAGADVYREDHNFAPAAAFRAGDALQGANRSGITENFHFQGKFKLWERIIDWQKRTGRPAFIEMQSAGGNRQDLSLLRYSVSFFRSDSDIVLDPPFTVSKVNTLNKWIPFGGVLFGRVSETDGTNPRDKYQWRSAYSSNLCVPLQFQNLTEETWSLLQWGLEEFDKYKEYVFYDFYELTPVKPLYDKQQWVSRMYYDPVSKRGVLETFNFPDSKENVKVIKLQGVDPDLWYSLTDPDGINGTSVIKGSELIKGYEIYLSPRSSSLIWIDSINL